MSLFAFLLLLISSIALLKLPRQWAPLPLLFGACYMQMDGGIQLGPFSFTLLRLLIAIGFLRKISRGERLTGGMQGLDYLLIAWGIWCSLSGLFHPDPGAAIIFRMGRAYNILGIYFLIRTFCSDTNSVILLCKSIAILLLPIALGMLYEQVGRKNLFSLLGSVSEHPAVRDGRIRAQGPFRHAILAGTVGAACLPFMIAYWKTHRKMAILGGLACVSMVFAAVSSGPIMTFLAATGAAVLWRVPGMARAARWGAVFTYIAAEIVMERPAYYLISMIDLTGSSTAYFRSKLIDSSIKHLSEWWLAGTDYTRHWMPTGVSWNPNHTDLTNQYIAYGVWGGLPLVLLFIAVLVRAFVYVSRITRNTLIPDDLRFQTWMLGAALFSHVVTFVSVSYYDQSYVFVYVTLGAIGSMYAAQQEGSFDVTRADDALTESESNGTIARSPSWRADPSIARSSY